MSVIKFQRIYISNVGFYRGEKKYRISLGLEERNRVNYLDNSRIS